VLTRWMNAKTPPPPAVSLDPQQNSADPKIERVVDGGRGKIIEGWGSPGAQIVFTFGGEGNVHAGFLNNSHFTASIEHPLFGGGINCQVKDALGNVLFAVANNKFGKKPGRFVLREGALRPEPDGSYILGEFQPEGGKPWPITVRLERARGKKAEPQLRT